MLIILPFISLSISNIPIVLEEPIYLSAADPGLKIKHCLFYDLPVYEYGRKQYNLRLEIRLIFFLQFPKEIPIHESAKI